MSNDPNVIAIHPPGGIQVTDLPPLPDVPPPPWSGVQRIPVAPAQPADAPMGVDVNPPAPPPPAETPPEPTAAPEPKWVAEALAHLARPTRKKAYAVAAAVGVAAVAVGLNAAFFRAARPPAETPAEVAVTTPPAEDKPAPAEPRKAEEPAAAPLVPLGSPIAPAAGLPQWPAETATPQPPSSEPPKVAAPSFVGLPAAADAPVPLAKPAVPVIPVPAVTAPAPGLPALPDPDRAAAAPPVSVPAGFAAATGAPAAEKPVSTEFKAQPAAEVTRPADRVTNQTAQPPLIPAPDPTVNADPTFQRTTHTEAAPLPAPPPLPKDAAPKSPAPAPPATVPVPALPPIATPPAVTPPKPELPLPAAALPVQPAVPILGGLPPAIPEVQPATTSLTLPAAATPAPPPPPAVKPLPTPAAPLPTPSAFTETPAVPATPTYPPTVPNTLTLTKPADAAALPPTPPPVADPNVRKPAFEVDLHEAQRGETFEAVSRRHYGNDNAAAALRAFNGGRELAPGTTVQLPPLATLRRMGGPAWAASPGTRPTPEARVYTAPRDGLSLWDVAFEVYGTKAEWGRIHAANPDRDPNLRYKAGDTFRLPADAPARPRTARGRDE